MKEDQTEDEHRPLVEPYQDPIDIDQIIATSSTSSTFDQQRKFHLTRKHPSSSNLKILSQQHQTPSQEFTTKLKPQRSQWGKFSFKNRNASLDDVTPSTSTLNEYQNSFTANAALGSTIPSTLHQHKRTPSKSDPTSISGIFQDYPAAAAAILESKPQSGLAILSSPAPTRMSEDQEDERRSISSSSGIMSYSYHQGNNGIHQAHNSSSSSSSLSSSSSAFTFNFKKKAMTIKSMFNKKSGSMSSTPILSSTSNGPSSLRHQGTHHLNNNYGKHYPVSSINHISEPALFLEPSFVDKVATSSSPGGSRLHPVLAPPSSPVQVQRLTASPLRSLNLESEWSHQSLDSLDWDLNTVRRMVSNEEILLHSDKQPMPQIVKSSNESATHVPTPPPTNPSSSVSTPRITPETPPIPTNLSTAGTETTLVESILDNKIPKENSNGSNSLLLSQQGMNGDDIEKKNSSVPNLSLGKLAQLHREIMMEAPAREFTTLTELPTTNSDVHTDVDIEEVTPSKPNLDSNQGKNTAPPGPFSATSSILPEIATSPILAYFATELNEQVLFGANQVSPTQKLDSQTTQKPSMPVVSTNAPMVASPEPSSSEEGGNATRKADSTTTTASSKPPKSPKQTFQVPNRASSLVLLSAAQATIQSLNSERRPSLSSLFSTATGSVSAASISTSVTNSGQTSIIQDLESTAESFATTLQSPPSQSPQTTPTISSISHSPAGTPYQARRLSTRSATISYDLNSYQSYGSTQKRPGSPRPFRSPTMVSLPNTINPSTSRSATSATPLVAPIRSSSISSSNGPGSPRSPTSVRSFRSPLSSHATIPLATLPTPSQPASIPLPAISMSPAQKILQTPPLVVLTEPEILSRGTNPNQLEIHESPVASVLESPEHMTVTRVSPSVHGTTGGGSGTLERAAAKIAAHRRSRSDFVTGPLHFGEENGQVNGKGSVSAGVNMTLLSPVKENSGSLVQAKSLDSFETSYLTSSASPQHPTAGSMRPPTAGSGAGKSYKSAKTLRKWTHNQSTPNLVSPPDVTALSSAGTIDSNHTSSSQVVAGKKSDTNLFSFFSGASYRFKNQSSGGLSKTSHGSGGHGSSSSSASNVPDWLGLTTGNVPSLTSSSSSTVLADTLMGTGGTEVTTTGSGNKHGKNRYSNRRSTISVSPHDVEKLKDLFASQAAHSPFGGHNGSSNSSQNNKNTSKENSSNNSSFHITVPRRGQSLVHSISSRSTTMSMMQIAEGEPIPVQWIPLTYSRFGQPWRPRRPLLILNLNPLDPDEALLLPKPRMGARNDNNVNTPDSSPSALISGQQVSKKRRKVNRSKKDTIGRSDSKLDGGSRQDYIDGVGNLPTLDDVKETDSISGDEIADDNGSMVSEPIIATTDKASSMLHTARDMRLTVESEFSRRTTSVGAGGTRSTMKSNETGSSLPEDKFGKNNGKLIETQTSPQEHGGKEDLAGQNVPPPSPAMTSQMPPSLMAFASQFHSHALQQQQQRQQQQRQNNSPGSQQGGAKFSKKFGKGFLPWKNHSNASGSQPGTHALPGNNKANSGWSPSAWTGHRAQSGQIAWNQQLYDPVQVAATMGSIALPKDKRGSYDPYPDGRRDDDTLTRGNRGKSLDLPREKISLAENDSKSVRGSGAVSAEVIANNEEQERAVKGLLSISPSKSDRRRSSMNFSAKMTDPYSSQIESPKSARKLRPRSISLTFSMNASQASQQQLGSDEKSPLFGMTSADLAASLYDQQHGQVRVNRRESTMTTCIPDLATDGIVALSFAYGGSSTSLAFVPEHEEETPKAAKPMASFAPLPPPKEPELKPSRIQTSDISSKRLSKQNRRKSFGALSDMNVDNNTAGGTKSYDSNPSSATSATRGRSLASPRRSSLSFSSVALSLSNPMQSQQPSEVSGKNAAPPTSSTPMSRRSQQFSRNGSPALSPRSSLQLVPGLMDMNKPTGADKVKSPLGRISMSFDRFFNDNLPETEESKSRLSVIGKPRQRNSMAFSRPSQIVTDPDISFESSQNEIKQMSNKEEEDDDFDDSASALYSANTEDYGDTVRSASSLFGYAGAAATLRRLRTRSRMNSPKSPVPSETEGSGKLIPSDARSISSTATSMSRSGFSLRLNKLTSLFKRSSTTLAQSPVHMER